MHSDRCRRRANVQSLRTAFIFHWISNLAPGTTEQSPRVVCAGLGSGEHLLTGIDLPALGYERTEHVPTSAATHVVLARRG